MRTGDPSNRNRTCGNRLVQVAVTGLDILFRGNAFRDAAFFRVGDLRLTGAELGLGVAQIVARASANASYYTPRHIGGQPGRAAGGLDGDVVGPTGLEHVADEQCIEDKVERNNQRTLEGREVRAEATGLVVYAHHLTTYTDRRRIHGCGEGARDQMASVQRERAVGVTVFVARPVERRWICGRQFTAGGLSTAGGIGRFALARRFGGVGKRHQDHEDDECRYEEEGDATRRIRTRRPHLKSPCRSSALRTVRWPAARQQRYRRRR